MSSISIAQKRESKPRVKPRKLIWAMLLGQNLIFSLTLAKGAEKGLAPLKPLGEGVDLVTVIWLYDKTNSINILGTYNIFLLLKYTQLLCISTSVWVLAHPEASWNTFFGRFKSQLSRCSKAKESITRFCRPGRSTKVKAAWYPHVPFASMLYAVAMCHNQQRVWEWEDQWSNFWD